MFSVLFIPASAAAFHLDETAEKYFGGKKARVVANLPYYITTPVLVRLFEYKKYFSWLEKNIQNYKKNKNIRLFGPSGEQKSVGVVIYFFMLLHKFRLVRFFAAFYCKGRS